MTQPAAESTQQLAAFDGHRLIASGSIGDVLATTKRHQHGSNTSIQFFSAESGRQVDFDLRGSLDEVLERAGLTHAPQRTGPGRPKLGVVSREVSLLPRHWEWLEEQPSGISATLRRLVDEARRHETAEQRARRRQDAAYRFMSAIAGDLPHFEEAARALYANDHTRMAHLMAHWPRDVREYALRMASAE
jgi:hypothetical protein